MTTAIAAPALACPGPREVARDGVGNGRGEWDWFYSLPTHTQNSLRYSMSPTGIRPDEWAATMGFDDVERAMDYWRGLVAESRKRDEWEDYEEPDDPEYLGPAEAAELLGVARSTIRQWRRRGIMPEPAMSFRAGSGKGDRLPVWRTDDIIRWQGTR